MGGDENRVFKKTFDIYETGSITRMNCVIENFVLYIFTNCREVNQINRSGLLTCLVHGTEEESSKLLVRKPER